MEQGIFYRPRQLWRIVICLVIAICLFTLSITKKLDNFRVALDSYTTKLFIFSYGAESITSHLSTNFKNVGMLNEEVEELQQQIVLLKQQLSSLEAINKDNLELRKVLNLKNNLVAKQLLVSIINTEQGVKNNIIFINKGSQDGLFIGQNIFDAQGLIGQVIAVTDYQARVLLINDLSSFVPVVNLRTGEHFVVQGNNSFGLKINYFRTKSDIKADDVLYTSGLGGRFIPNYPVAQITQVSKDKKDNIVAIFSKPTAKIKSLSYLVAVWPYCNLYSTISHNNLFDFTYREKLEKKLYQPAKVKPWFERKFTAVDINKYLLNISRFRLNTSLNQDLATPLSENHCFMPDSTSLESNLFKVAPFENYRATSRKTK